MFDSEAHGPGSRGFCKLFLFAKLRIYTFAKFKPSKVHSLSSHYHNIFFRHCNSHGLLHATAAFSFGFGKKKQENKTPFGGENPYRIFGVTEDAPYEEVEMAYKELCEEHAGNDKYLIKLEMMKEKIFDDRLKARMSGALKSKIKDSPFEKKLLV
jgi:hypothetical protein